MNQRLYRSRDERIIFGVAGGLGEYFHVDPSLVRILWVVVAFATFGAAVLLYLVIALIVPEEPAGTIHGADWGRARSGYQWPEEAAFSRANESSATTASTAASPAGAAPNPPPGIAAPFVASTPPSVTVPDAPTPPSAPMGTESIPVAGPKPAAATPATATAATAQQAGATRADARAQARQQRREARAERRAARGDGRGALFWGLLLVLVGGYFVVRTYFPDVDVDRLWPIVVIILGIALVLAAFRRSPGPTA